MNKMSYMYREINEVQTLDLQIQAHDILHLILFTRSNF